MRHFPVLVPILAIVLMAAPALGQVPPVADRTALPIPKPMTAPPSTAAEAADKLAASKALLAMMKPVWSSEQIGKIMFIGYHNAAAALCADLEVDPAKMARAVAYFAPPARDKISPERLKFLHDNLSLDIGLATGWVMAGNFRDLRTFCGKAVAGKAEMPADKHLFETGKSVAAVAPAKK